jgi:hypothetical protein
VQKRLTELSRIAAPGPRSLLALALLGASVMLSACANTLQDRPISSNVLEQLVMVRQYPIYWLGGSFAKMQITNVMRDPSGAFTIQYGDCVEGGQSTCVPPLSVITSPDNSFHPAGSAPSQTLDLRGVHALLTQGGKTIELASGGVIIDIYANDPPMASAAAQAVVPINQRGLPGGALPRPLTNTGFAEQPLVSQTPPPVPQMGG